jgi:hypothetical protein
VPRQATITPEYVKRRWFDIAPRFTDEWNRMELCEAWRSLNLLYLKHYIWAGVAAQDWGKITIVKNTVSAVVSSAVALANSPEPSISVKMRNRVSPAQREVANFDRRAVLGIRAEINNARPVPWEDEVTDHIFVRAVGIVKHAYLDPVERGERRVPVTADDATELSQQRIVTETDAGGAPVSQQYIEDDGEFPICIDVLDPLDCVYILGPGKRGLKLMIHAQRATADDVLAIYPDAAGKIKALANADDLTSTTLVDVLDYWDEEQHAVVIADEFYYPPTPHGLKRLPFEVERVAEQTLRFNGRGGQFVELPTGELGRASAQSGVSKIATPFPWPMIDDVTKASFAESLLASKLPEMANSPIIHHGISTGETGPASPYFRKVKYTDGNYSQVPVYRFRGDKTAGGRPIWPLFNQENMFPLNPTPIADHLAIFMQQRNADLEISGMNAELLSGRIRSEPSGFSVNQQIQLTSARMNPYVGGRNRLVGRVYTGVFRDLDENWDRGNAPFILTTLTGQEDIEITRDMAENVSEVLYSVENIFPRDTDGERQAAFQALSQGVKSKMQVMDLLGDESPLDTMKQIAWEMMASQDYRFIESLATERHRELGFGDLAPSPEAQAAAAQQQAMGAAPAMPPEGGAPVEGGGGMDPAMQQIEALLGAAAGGQ